MKIAYICDLRRLFRLDKCKYPPPPRRAIPGVRIKYFSTQHATEGRENHKVDAEGLLWDIKFKYNHFWRALQS